MRVVAVVVILALSAVALTQTAAPPAARASSVDGASADGASADGASVDGASVDGASVVAAPYVPSPHDIVGRMLALADVGPDDFLIDLGSGDGRIVLSAAHRFGARGLGVEIREDLVAQSNRAAIEHGVADRVRFLRQDLFDTDLSEATVVTLYLLPEMVNRLRDRLLWELKPGTRVLSHDYPIENWKAEQVVRIEHPAKVDVTGVARTMLYLYRVPADLDGYWTASWPAAIHGDPVALEFAQRVTAVLGRVHLDGRLVPLEDVVLSGRRLSFTLPEAEARFTAEVDDRGVIEGRVHARGESRPWRAVRGRP